MRHCKPNSPIAITSCGQASFSPPNQRPHQSTETQLRKWCWGWGGGGGIESKHHSRRLPVHCPPPRPPPPPKRARDSALSRTHLHCAGERGPPPVRRRQRRPLLPRLTSSARPPRSTLPEALPTEPLPPGCAPSGRWVRPVPSRPARRPGCRQPDGPNLLQRPEYHATPCVGNHADPSKKAVIPS